MYYLFDMEMASIIAWGPWWVVLMLESFMTFWLECELYNTSSVDLIKIILAFTRPVFADSLIPF